MTISPIAAERNSRFGRLALTGWPSGAILILGILTLLRVAAAARVPLSFDEAYFWLWTKNLAVSYYDHPPLLALVVRLSTLLFGDTEFGVRFVPVLASIAASWAVWRAGAALSGERVGAAAAVFFNLTLMLASQGMAATPDSLVLAASAFLLLAIAKLQQSEDGRWWLAVGAALGLAFLSKYTAFFLGGSIALWLFASKENWRWLKTPWPYLAASIAIAAFLPNLIWNATHDWVSFKFQFGRVVSGGFTLRFLFEFLGGQIVLASPVVLFLALRRFAHDFRGWTEGKSLTVCTALVLPASAYFLLHAFHDRVQANWPSFIYPALAILAAQALMALSKRKAEIAELLAVSIAVIILMAAYAQLWFTALPLGIYDPFARTTALGLAPVTEDISRIAAHDNASAILTTNYVTTGWLSFYLHPQLPVVPVTADYRWLQTPKARVSDLNKPLLYVTQRPNEELSFVAPHFSNIRLEKILFRRERGAEVDKFYVYSLSGFHGAAIGHLANISRGST